MNVIREITGRHRALFVVVHTTSPTQAAEQADLALLSGADGIFLISHGSIVGHELVRIADRVASEPDWADRVVGVNLLDRGTVDAISQDVTYRSTAWLEVMGPALAKTAAFMRAASVLLGETTSTQ